MELFFRFHLPDNEIDELLKRVGWNDSNIKDKMKGLNYRLLSVGEVMEAYRRGVLQSGNSTDHHGNPIHTIGEHSNNPDTMMENYLKALKYSTYEVGIITELGKPKLDVRTLIEATFRKTPGIMDLDREIGKHGFDPIQRDILRDTSKQLLREFDIIQLLWREEINKDEAIKRLSYLGYKDDDSELFLKSRKLLLTPSDLIRAAVKEAFNPEIVAEFGMDRETPEAAKSYAKTIGYESKEFDILWRTHWDLPSPGQGYDMLHRGLITEAQLKLLLKALDVMPFWRDKMFQLSYNLIPRRAISTIVRRGLLSESETYGRFKKLGYNTEDSSIMARNLIMAKDEKLINLTISEISNALRRLFIDTDTAISYLRRFNVESPKINYIIAEAERKQFNDVKMANKESDKIIAAQAKQLTKGELLSNYRKGVFSVEEVRSRLRNIGYSLESISWLIGYEDLQKTVDQREHKSEQIEKLYRASVISVGEASDELGKAGFAVPETMIMVERWKLEENTRQALESVRDKKPTTSQLKKWVSNGIMKPIQWVYWMEQLGYSDEIMLYHFLEIEDKIPE